ncbi:DUF2202 domain-containing protein, partial [Candidatus Nomurabacteria bacterium]|nr:DUF2202 domain-containing protein [Candidatus Nomurabacteria bacterium]
DFFLILTGGIFLPGCSPAAGSADENGLSRQETTEAEAVGTDQSSGGASEENGTMDPYPRAIPELTLSPEGYGASGALSDDDLSLQDMLLYAVQDEYLAHGEYLAVSDKFGSETPYKNIVRSEETHLAYPEDIYREYEMPFPPDTSSEHLIIPENLLEAAQTGVKAEIDNIAMYELFLTCDLPEDIRQVFTSLKRGSDSHLPAFQKQADKLSR